ncbi:MAG: signal peptidase I [Cytophagales bacterium]|nr:MAG: signal peptidase I [Cytophagales bacterium]TAF60041.1 MAG: signal peptidase I [Cytophagales bacterium]
MLEPETISTDSNKKPKSKIREWSDAIVFAVVAATLIRWLFLEAFKIPTPSMEKSLLVGDFLFVSKFHYGSRIPKTILQLPLTHQTIWGTSIPSYLDWIQLPDFRLPGLSEVKRNDVVVFNFPPEEQYPIDLKTNYIKRCIAQAGDILEVKEGDAYVNGKLADMPEKIQHSYLIVSKDMLTPKFLLEHNITDLEQVAPLQYQKSLKLWKELDKYDSTANHPVMVVHTSPETAKKLKNYDFVLDVLRVIRPKGVDDERVFPKLKGLGWSMDNYGPVTIPKAGSRVEINRLNAALYGEIIKKYEGNDQVEINVEAGSIKIDGNQIKDYTFKQNYYFMMGDNRHNSLDSRCWGFVPENHVVGKGFMIWWSVAPPNEESGIRWNRIFNLIQ